MNFGVNDFDLKNVYKDVVANFAVLDILLK
jgi:hypothetical protein